MKKRREPTEEQKAKAAERKAQLREICNQIKAMDDGERARLASRMQVRSVTGATLSAHNQCMVAFQKADATIVGGFRQWLKEGRAVKKGEHGLGIWIPRFEKGEGEDGPGSLEGFLFGTVFDVTQTDAVTV